LKVYCSHVCKDLSFTVLPLKGKLSANLSKLNPGANTSYQSVEM